LIVKLKPGEMVGQYRIENQIGKGGFATVFKAVDTGHKDSPFVALKVAKAITYEGENRERFDHESKLLSILSHENIVGHSGHGSDRGFVYLALDLIDGNNLAEIVGCGFGIDYIDATKIILDIAKTFPHLEDMGVYHRDIKPENILVDKSGKAVLIDFGLAWSSHLDLKEEKDQVCGTLNFLAPEYLKNGDYLNESDIYALGVTYYNAITNRLPIDGRTSKEVIIGHVSRKPVIDLPSNVPDEVRHLIFRMLKKDPSLRPTVYDLVEKLEQILREAQMNLKKKSKWKLLGIVKSTRADKKLLARFENRKTNKVKKVHFGGAGYSDYTKHKDDGRKANYIKRHSKRENWKDPTTPGALSRWVLWNLPTFKASKADFIKRFGLN